MALYRSKNVEKIRQYNNIYRNSNKEKINSNQNKLYNSKYKLHKYWPLLTLDKALEEYQKLIIEQKGRCKICGFEGKLVIDHCHKTAKVRGLLCDPCNCGIGNLKDNPEICILAAEYLKLI